MTEAAAIGKLKTVDMTIKDLGPQVANVWERLRPKTKQLLVGAMQTGTSLPPTIQTQNFHYDAHADWELSSLLAALDEHRRSAEKGEAAELAETCARILESQSGSAEVFIQLATRAIKNHDYNKLETLAEKLYERYSASEIAEIVRQTELPQIRALAYETLAMLPVAFITPLLDDPLYSDIALNSLEQKAFEYDSEEARDALEKVDSDIDARDI